MKTFRELISWELEQEANQTAPKLSLTEDAGAGKLGASVLRKLRYIRSGASEGKSGSEVWSAA
jgi:hypothetical protein